MLTDMLGQKKITHVSGNEKNLPLSCRKLLFFNQFSGDILFSSLVSFAFFDSCFVCLVG